MLPEGIVMMLQKVDSFFFAHVEPLFTERVMAARFIAEQEIAVSVSKAADAAEKDTGQRK
jgi:hypothetical protein